MAPIGAILIIIAMYKLSKSLGDRLIWRYTLYALLIGIAGVVALIPASMLLSMYLSANAFGNPTLTYYISNAIMWMVPYPFTIGSGYLWRRAFRELAIVSSIESFNSTAKWVWYGALTGIIPIAGAILEWIAYYHAYKSFRALEVR